ncbi:MAG: DUF4197 domain-containing protein [Cellvibrionaceae bacterium]
MNIDSVNNITKGIQRVKPRHLMITAVLSTSLMISAPSMAGWFDKLTEVLGDSSSTGSAATGTISNADIGQAFKQALEIGSDNVVQQLSKAGGYNNDPAIHIPLPNELKTARKWLDKIGMGGTLDNLEDSLNSAAEKATPQAKALFVDAIKEMSFDDVRAIYNGPTDSATRYFQSKMTPKLTETMTPVVSDSLSQVGAVKRYDDVISNYQSIPFVPDIKADLTSHVVQGGLDGIFHYLAEQEAAIRKNPVEQTTALLKKVFGGK